MGKPGLCLTAITIHLGSLGAKSVLPSTLAMATWAKNVLPIIHHLVQIHRYRHNHSVSEETNWFRFSVTKRRDPACLLSLIQQLFPYTLVFQSVVPNPSQMANLLGSLLSLLLTFIYTPSLAYSPNLREIYRFPNGT